MGLCNATAAFEKFEDLHDRRILINFNLGFRGDCEGGVPSQGLCRLLLSRLSRRLQAFGHILEFAITICGARRVDERTINKVRLLV